MSARRYTSWICVAHIFAIASAASAKEPPISATAAICENASCTQRASVAFGPVRVDVQIRVRLHPLNRAITYGLACDGTIVRQSGPYDLNGRDDNPLFLRTYRDVEAGQCMAVAIVERADGTHHAAHSPPIIIRDRFEVAPAEYD